MLGTERVLHRAVREHRQVEEPPGFDESIYTYGTSGTPDHARRANRLAEWEGRLATVLFPSGLAAVAYAFLPFVAPGDHVLIPANVYDPVKTLANGLLKRMNVTVEQYGPAGSVPALPPRSPNTVLVWWKRRAPSRWK